MSSTERERKTANEQEKEMEKVKEWKWWESWIGGDLLMKGTRKKVKEFVSNFIKKTWFRNRATSWKGWKVKCWEKRQIVTVPFTRAHFKAKCSVFSRFSELIEDTSVSQTEKQEVK